MRHRHHTGSTDVEAYCQLLSHLPGDQVAVHCSARSETFSVEVARIGADREVVWRRSGLRAADQHSEQLDDTDEAWAHGCDWPVGFVVPTERSWPSGFYHIRLVPDADAGGGAGGHGEAFFVLRPTPEPPTDRTARLLLVLSTNTWNAYNQWGGRCLYSGARQVSFSRPLERGYLHRPSRDGFDGRVANTDGDREHTALRRYQAEGHWPLWTASAGWHNWERRFVAWAESNGHVIDVAVNSDLEFHPEVLEGTTGLLSVGHDEYWSWPMRDAVDHWVEGGGRWAVFSGNTCFWQVRYADGGRTMICHRSTARTTDRVDDLRLMTGMWSDPLIGRAENSTTGLSFTRGGYVRMGDAESTGSGAYTIHRPDHWALDSTGLRRGDQVGGDQFVVAYEVDGCDLRWIEGLPEPTGSDGTPTYLEIIATAPARLISITADRCEAPAALWADVEPPGDLEFTATVLFGDDRPEHVARIARGHAVMGSFRRGRGSVFNAGTTDWAYGLGRPGPADPAVERITRNVLQHLVGGPGTVARQR